MKKPASRLADRACRIFGSHVCVMIMRMRGHNFIPRGINRPNFKKGDCHTIPQDGRVMPKGFPLLRAKHKKMAKF